MTCRTKLIRIRILTLVIFALATSCKHDSPGGDIGADPSTGTTGNNASNNTPQNGAQCSQDTVYFVQQVLPVFQSSCAMSGCHNSVAQREGVVLDSYNGILSTGGIKVSNPASSRVYRAMLSSGENRMPPFPAVAVGPDQLATILKWIQQGARDNSCIASGCDTSNVKYSTHIRPVIQTYCQGCHSGTLAGGGIDLVTYAGVKAIADNGKLLGSIRFLPGYSPMPKGGSKLSECDITKVNLWINSGSPSN